MDRMTKTFIPLGIKAQGITGKYIPVLTLKMMSHKAKSVFRRTPMIYPYRFGMLVGWVGV